MGHGDDEPRGIAIEARFCVLVGIPGQARNDKDGRPEFPSTAFVTPPNPSNQSTLIVYVDHRLPGSSCENHFSRKTEPRPSMHLPL